MKISQSEQKKKCHQIYLLFHISNPHGVNFQRKLFTEKGFVLFYSISTIVGYLMSNPLL